MAESMSLDDINSRPDFLDGFDGFFSHVRGGWCDWVEL